MITCNYNWPLYDILNYNSPLYLHQVLDTLDFPSVRYIMLGVEYTQVANQIKYEIDITMEDFLVLKLKDNNFSLCTS